MRAKLMLFSFFVWVLVGMLTLPAQAQSPLADVRAQVNELFVQLHTFDNVCVIILGAQLKELGADILEGRKLVTVDKGNLNRLLRIAFLAAINHVNRILDTLRQCRTLLGTEDDDDDEAGSIFGELDTLDDDGIERIEGLDPRKAIKIEGLLDNVEGSLEVIAEVRSSISSIVAGILVSLGLLSAECLEPNSSEPISAIAVPQLTEKGNISFACLRIIKQRLGILHSQLVSALRLVREITKAKKWVYKGLREIYYLLRTSNFGGRAAGASSGSVTRVYTLAGALLPISIQKNADLSRALRANGIYLAVTEHRDTTGKIITHVRKIALAR